MWKIHYVGSNCNRYPYLWVIYHTTNSSIWMGRSRIVHSPTQNKDIDECYFTNPESTLYRLHGYAPEEGLGWKLLGKR